MIYSERKRLLYKDIKELFINNNELFENIQKYVLKMKDNDLICKEQLSNEKFNIYGESDLIDKTNKKIIDFKCSDSDNFKIEWLLQLLAYASLIRLNDEYKNITIDCLEIYNPIRGLLFTFDISNWKKEEEFIKYMDMVRYRQINKNKEQTKTVCNKIIIKEKIIENYREDKYNDQLDFIEDNEWMVENLIKSYNVNTNKMAIDILKKYYEKNRNIKPINVINKIALLLNFTYMVIDTETNGTPICKNFNEFPDYKDLVKYNNARIIQLSWNIYNEKKLERNCDFFIYPNNFTIENSNIHGISFEKAKKEGIDIKDILNIFYMDLLRTDIIIAHNAYFDLNVIKSEAHRINNKKIIEELNKKKIICTLECSNEKLKKKKIIKSSKLNEIYKFFFNKEITNHHNSKYDIMHTWEIFNEMVKKNLIRI
jgi:DNA polymerase III epsilon subunit-like protein